MPDQIRAGGLAVVAGFFAPATSRADDLAGFADTALDVLKHLPATVAALDRHELINLTLILGVALFGVVTAIMLVRARSRAAATEAMLREELGSLRAEADRSNAMLRAEPQVLVSWAAADNEPDIIGDTTLITTARSRSACCRSAPGSSRTRRRRWSAQPTRCAPPAKASRCS